MNKFSLTGAIAAGIITLCNIQADAIPARHGLFTFTQPDGTEINVRLVGDEHAHFYLTEDGYLLINNNDTFFYGEIDDTGSIAATDIKARSVGERTTAENDFLKKIDKSQIATAIENCARERTSIRYKSRRNSVARAAAASPGPGLFPGTSYPSKGDQKAIVILVEYTDVKFQTPDPVDYFSRMLNEEGFSSYNGTGSARDFFIENSGGQFTPQFDLYGPIALPHNMAYYGANDAYGNDMRPHKMVIEACEQLDDTVDFSEYDRDKDGYIDNIYVFYAGRGEASGAPAATVWPHSWDISEAEPSSKYMFDGVQLNRYACSNEWEQEGTSGRPDGIGTFVHEFSHVMGLPDLYATAYSDAFTPGTWSALDYGPYNNDGCTPPNYGAFERYALGWMDPEIIDHRTTITLEPVSSNKACIIPTSSENEFFLLENRQQDGWDKYIPGHGMLIWHVDYNSSVWTANTVNNSSYHQYVDIEEADNIQSEGSRAGDTFPGVAGKTSFTDDTTPSMRTWNGAKLNLPITDITENEDGTITFNVAGGAILPGKVTATQPVDLLPSSFTATWNKIDDTEGYLLTVSAVDGDKRIPVGQWDNFDAGLSLSVDVAGLEPETTYCYTVAAYNVIGNGEASDEIMVTTPTMTFEFYMPQVHDATDITGNSFTASWEALEGATSYSIDVYYMKNGDPFVDSNDFTGGTASMPEGWTSSSKLTYAMATWSGNASPSLRLGSNGDYLQTPVFDDEISEISFWHRGSNTGSSSMSLMALVDGSWIMAKKCDIVTTSGGTTVTVNDEIPAGTTSLKLVFDRVGAGALAIDDVVVKHGHEKTVSYLDGYHPCIVEDATSVKITGLETETTYHYTVTASNGEVNSLTSREVEAVTRSLSGIGLIEADETPVVTIAGDIVTVNAPGAATATLVDLAGHIVDRAVISDGQATFHISTPGFYLVTVDNRRAVKIAKY